jgi:hypothetical protein
MNELNEFLDMLKVAKSEEMTNDALSDSLDDLSLEQESLLFQFLVNVSEREFMKVQISKEKYLNEQEKNKKKLNILRVTYENDLKHVSILNAYTKSDDEKLRAIRKKTDLSFKRYFKALARTHNIKKSLFKHEQHYKNVALLLNDDRFIYYSRVELIYLYFVVMKIDNVSVQLVSSSINRFN